MQKITVNNGAGSSYARYDYVGENYNVGVYDHVGTGYAGDHAHSSLDYYINSIDGIKAHTHQVGIPALAATTTYKNNNQSNINIQNPYITVYMWKRVK